MLFYQLLSRGVVMHEVCSVLLGVDITKVHPEKMRLSSENFLKDQVLHQALQRCSVVLPAPLQTYYGNDKLHHGIDTYINRLLDTRQVTHSFIHPFEYDTDEDVLSFQFLNSVNLLELMRCQPDGLVGGPVGGPPGEEFRDLLRDGFQPRAYEFLLQRLTDKFSILTKEYDEELRSQVAEAIKESKKNKSPAGSAGVGVEAAGPASVLPTIAQEIAHVLHVHGGKNAKDIRSQFKVRQLDAFIGSFVSELLDPIVTPEQIKELIYKLISSTEDACFEGKEDDVSKFRELEPDQRKYWLDHLVEMIGFFKSLSIHYPIRAYLELSGQNITKYSKLLFLLKKYLIPKPTQPGLLELTSEQLSGALESIFESLPQPPHQAAANKKAVSHKAKGGVYVSSDKPPLPQTQSQTLVPPSGPEFENALSDIFRLTPTPSRDSGRSTTTKGKKQGGGSPKASVSKTKTNPKTRNNRYSKNARTRRHKHKRKQHRNRKNKKTKNKKSQSKKNVTFKRRRR